MKSVPFYVPVVAAHLERVRLRHPTGIRGFVRRHWLSRRITWAEYLERVAEWPNRHWPVAMGRPLLSARALQVMGAAKAFTRARRLARFKAMAADWGATSFEQSYDGKTFEAECPEEP